MLSEQFLEYQEVTHFAIFRKMYGGFLFFYYVFCVIKMGFGPAYPDIKNRLDCYDIWYGNMFCSLLNFILFLIILYVIFHTTYESYDFQNKATAIVISQCLLIGQGLWALVMQFTISNSCYTYWTENTPNAPIIWIYINIYVWMLWFILGMDCVYLLIWKYGN